MPITLDEIVEETRQLPPDVVAELVDRIMLTLHGGMEPPVETAWKTEINRRIDEIKTGKVQGVPSKNRWHAPEKLPGCEIRPPF